MIRDAVTCDTTNCLALLLEPAGDYPAATFEDFTRECGWSHGPEGHTCLPCRVGKGPVLERGECEWCGGRVTTRHGNELCMYCGHLTPDNGPEWQEEGWGDDDSEDQDQDAMPTGPGEWAGAGGEEDQGEGAAR
ncbi:hypothetical protein [Streptomyces soliscabiei]|uniref:hypothetical protein n=1 Tax=Streptomyces soliscabiei TaxID=588897 RepID=UPI0029A49E58|nr:hypothetical protein [Streptomyces sp. NY05-11A]MDX2683694.1 hypothetical protein [Streptomyces sp. NY05-11A]